MAPWLVAWITCLREEDRPSAESEAAAPRIQASAREAGMIESISELEERVTIPGTANSGWQLHIVGAAVSCCTSVWIVLTILPISNITAIDEPRYNFTCKNEGDLTRYVHDRDDLHFILQNDTVLSHSMPGVGGAWLPFCATVPVSCQAGYFPSASAVPSLSCMPDGKYNYQGTCTGVSCEGQPPTLANAEPKAEDVKMQNWTYGMTVRYDCKEGFHGIAEATCGIDGKWSIDSNTCLENSCGPAPTDIEHATPLVTTDSIHTATVVRYQCDQNYTGSPTATCGHEGLYVKEGRCLRLCGEPPMLAFASPNYDNDLVKEGGWSEGMRASYACHPGYVGFVTAVCASNGSYVIGGQCVHSSSPDAPSPVPAPDCSSCSSTTAPAQKNFSNVIFILFIVENALLLTVGALWVFRSKSAVVRRITSSRQYHESEMSLRTSQRPETLQETGES